MEVVGGELAGHSQVGLATQWDMSEHFRCDRVDISVAIRCYW